MDVKKIKPFGKKWGIGIVVTLAFIGAIALVAIGTSACMDKKHVTQTHVTQTHVTDPVSGYTILQEFGTNASDFSTDEEWINGWSKTEYFGVVNTIIVKKSTGDTINKVACIVLKKDYLTSVKQKMYDGAVDIIEATEEFDNIKTD